MTADTNRTPSVLTVSRRGCTVIVNGENKSITWDDLRDAAQQESIDDTTRALAWFYQSILERARQMVTGNRSLPITCSVHQDYTNVWWVASFADVTGERDWIPRAADEGGTLPKEFLARKEAEGRAARLRQMGYTVVEVH